VLAVSKSRPILRIRSPIVGREEVVFELASPRVTIGRGEACDVVLLEQAASRVHAEIRATEQGYVLSDEGSHNGVWVGDRRVTRHPLRDGDSFRIGGSTLQLVLNPHAQATFVHDPSIGLEASLLGRGSAPPAAATGLEVSTPEVSTPELVEAAATPEPPSCVPTLAPSQSQAAPVPQLAPSQSEAAPVPQPSIPASSLPLPLPPPPPPLPSQPPDSGSRRERKPQPQWRPSPLQPPEASLAHQVTQQQSSAPAPSLPSAPAQPPSSSWQPVPWAQLQSTPLPSAGAYPQAPQELGPSQPSPSEVPPSQQPQQAHQPYSTSHAQQPQWHPGHDLVVAAAPPQPAPQPSNVARPPSFELGSTNQRPSSQPYVMSDRPSRASPSFVWTPPQPTGSAPSFYGALADIDDHTRPVEDEPAPRAGLWIALLIVIVTAVAMFIAYALGWRFDDLFSR
jgi:hypothetical protein